MLVWFEFAICLTLIAMAGYRLSLYGDMIAEKAGLTRSWVGVVMVASITSLPELVSGLSSVTMAQAPDIAVGDILGSCVFNLTLIVVVDVLHRKGSVYATAQLGHTLSAGFGVILIGLVAVNLVLTASGAPLGLGHIGLYTPLILVLYALAIRAIFRYERSLQPSSAGAEDGRYAAVTLRQAVIGYTLAALVVVMAGIWLPFVAKALADHNGWGESFVGTLLVAAVTSLPEAVVSIAAVRIGALDMALGNLFGSNLFNVAILAVDDLAYLPGPLLAAVDPMHALSALSAMIMTGIALVGLVYRAGQRVLHAVGWTSLFLLTVYLFNSYAMYLYGH